MNYLEAKNRISGQLPFPVQGLVSRQVEDSFRARQLEAAAMKPDGWVFLKRRTARRNEGGYDEGTIEVAQNSRAVSGTGTAWSATMVDWRIAPTGAESEIYKIAARADGTNLTLDRPYEGDSESGLTYRAWDPYIVAPRDLHAWESLAFEVASKELGYASLGYVRGVWPNARSFGGAKITCLGPMTTVAKYETGTVGITAASATVTLAGGTWPEDVVGHHLKFGDERPLYAIKTRDSDTQVTLDRNYGGNIAASGLSYELDPPGAYQLEVIFPQEDQYGIKIEYFCEPQELVNDTDLIEGGELYASGLCDLAVSDVLEANIDIAAMDADKVSALYASLKMYRARGQNAIRALIEGHTPAPHREMVMKDTRYVG